MSHIDNDYSEKRDFIRMFINAPVDFAVDGSDEWLTGMGRDLSGGGLSFVTQHELPEGAMVTIKLHPVTPVTPPLEARVSVIRAVSNDEGEYEVSTKIEEILS